MTRYIVGIGFDPAPWDSDMETQVEFCVFDTITDAQMVADRINDLGDKNGDIVLFAYDPQRLTDEPASDVLRRYREELEESREAA